MGEELRAVNLNNMKDDAEGEAEVKKAAAIVLKYEDQILASLQKHHFALYKIAMPYVGKAKTVIMNIKEKGSSEIPE